MNFSAIDFAVICSRNPAKIARFCSLLQCFSRVFGIIHAKRSFSAKIFSYIKSFLQKSHKICKTAKNAFIYEHFFKVVANTLDYAKNLLVFVNFSAIDFAVICSRNPAKIARFAVFCSNFRVFSVLFTRNAPLSENILIYQGFSAKITQNLQNRKKCVHLRAFFQSCRKCS